MEQSLTLQPQQQLQQQQQQPVILNLSNIEYDLAGNGVGDPMAHPDQAALVLQQQPQPPQPILQAPQQPVVPQRRVLPTAPRDELDEILDFLARDGVDDPSALP